MCASQVADLGPASKPKSRILNDERRGLAFGLLASLIWGGYIAVSRAGVSAGLGGPDLAFIRYSVAGMVLAPWLISKNIRTLAGVGWCRGLALSLFAGPLFVIVGASGFHFAPLAHSAVIQLGSVTLMGIVLSALVLSELQGAKRFIGLVIVISGLAITAGPGLLASGSGVWRGDLLFFTAGTMWAIFTVLQRRWKVPALTATAVVSVVSALVYAPIYLLLRGIGPLSAVSIGTLLSQAIFLGLLAGVVALFAIGRAVEYLGPGRASLFPALAPGVAILTGIPITGELPSPGQLLGLVVLSAGLVIAVQAPQPGRPSRSR